MKIKHTAIAAIATLALSGGFAQGQTTQPGTGAGTSNQPGPAGTTNTPGNPGTSGQTTSGERDRQSGSGAATKAQAFMHQAAIGGLAEVELGRLASEKASSDEVKQFGQRMVTDHSKANTELQTLAQKKGVTLPTELDAKHKKTVEKLSKLSGAAFDRAYMDEMRKDHKKDVSAFKQQSTSGSDPEVKSWAAATLPTLQEHMQMAERTHSAVGTSGKSSRPGSTTDNAAGGKTGPHSGTGNTGGDVTETPAPAGR